MAETNLILKICHARRFIVQYHLVTTQRCNLNCIYCGNTVEPSLMPVNNQLSIQALQAFLKHDQDPVIAFYGGEPTMNLGFIFQVMDSIPAKAFMLQTNGTLLRRFPPEYISRFHTILVSIDGKEELTDYYRGKGTYRRILKGMKYARENGFKGDFVARMTVSEQTSIFEEVKHLVELTDPSFDHVHWQLDVMWDDDMNTRWEDFPKWLKKSYNPGISRLVQYWVEHMKQGELMGIVPFLGITHTLLTNQVAPLRCGAGIDFFSITTDGRITVCPIPPSIEFAVVGNIFQNKPSDLPGKVLLEEPCTSCEERRICGGRCLFTNKTKLWGREGFDLVCEATKHLIRELRDNLPVVRTLIDEGSFSLNDFSYPEIPNGVEIIP